MSHQAYGPRVAMPKLLRMLDRQGIRATFFVPVSRPSATRR